MTTTSVIDSHDERLHRCYDRNVDVAVYAVVKEAEMGQALYRHGSDLYGEQRPNHRRA